MHKKVVIFLGPPPPSLKIVSGAPGPAVYLDVLVFIIPTVFHHLNQIQTGKLSRMQLMNFADSLS